MRDEILARHVMFDDETQHWCIRTEDKDGWAHFGLYPTRAAARLALKKIKENEERGRHE